jgi:cysteine desulfurase
VLHTDACQSFTKETLPPRAAGLAAVSINAHKMHGPTGMGALYLRAGTACEPLLHGGGQERGLRAGTHHTAGIAGFGVAAAVADACDAARLRGLRDEFIADLEQRIDGVRLNGPRGAQRLCNNINISIAGIPGTRVLREMNRRGIMVATGSACASGKAAPSHVLTAMG